MNRAVHRLHCGVREEWNLVCRLNFGGCSGHGLVDITDILRNRPRIERRLFERARDVIGAELCVRSVIPFDHQGGQSFFRSAHMIGNDGDGVVEPHNLTDTLDGLGRRIIHTFHSTAEDGRLRKGRNLHAGRPNIDAVNGRSIDLRRCVETLGRGANKPEILRSFERHVFGDRHSGGICGKCAIFDASSRWRMKHFPVLCAAGCRVDVPLFCRGRDQHHLGGCAGLAQGLPRPAHRVRVSGCLHPQQGVGIELFVGRSMLQTYLL